MNTLLPICYYPTRKIILDDDNAFAQSILLKMHGKNFTAYNSPNEALEYLLKEYHPVLSTNDLIEKDPSITDSTTPQTININVDKLRKMILTSSHQDISVLLIDYHMPEIKGTEFLKAIKNLPLKKALITGEKDYNIAIDAFNSGLVDAYLRKDDIDFSNKIKNIISELEWKYFTDLSTLLTNIYDFGYLSNVNIISTFKKFIHDNNIDLPGFLVPKSHRNISPSC